MAAAGSWPSIEVEEEGERLRLSILPREAVIVNNKLPRTVNEWKAYLLAGLEAFGDVKPYSKGA